MPLGNAEIRRRSISVFRWPPRLRISAVAGSFGAKLVLVLVLLLLLRLIVADASLGLGPRVESTALPNGARLLLSGQHNLPLVVISVVLDAGARLDDPNLPGLANLTAEVLTEGTATRSAAALKEAVDSLGASLTAAADADYTALELRVLKNDAAAGLELLADVLLRPRFAETELARRREAVLAKIRARRDNPTAVAQRAFQAAVFPGEPYGHPVEGTEESVAAITRAQVQSFYRRYYRPGGAFVVVVGDLAAAEAQSLLSEALRDWGGDHSPVPPPASTERSPAQTVRVDRPVTQAAIILGHRGVARNHPDFETLSVMNYILGGGGFSSRLMESIRTRAGLAYSVSSFFSTNRGPGTFQIVMQTKNASVAEAITRARVEIDRIRNEGVTDDEVSEARKYLTGSFPLRLDSSTKIAQFIGQVALYGLGLDYAERYIERVNAVAKEDVLRVARQHLHPDALTEVIVADLSQAALPGRRDDK
jgi:zinc protease